MKPSAPTEQAPTHVCPPERRKFVLFAALLASAMGFIDGSVVSIAIPQIRASLNASFVEVQWVSNAYILFLSALLLVGGAAGDRFGIRRAFGFGIVFFLVASLLCAIVPTPDLLIAFRALQGLGAALMVPGSMAIIARNYPPQERGRALGLWIAGSSLTTSFGPMLAGVLLTYGGPEVWRVIFAINLPIGGLALYFLWSRVPDDLPVNRASIDGIGALLVILAMGALALGLTFLGEGGGHALAGPLIVAGLGFLFIVILWWRFTAHPMIDLDLFRSRTFSGANALTLLVWAGLGAMFFFLPMVLVTGWAFSELEVAGTFLPFGLTIAALSSLFGRLSSLHGFRIFLTIGPLVAAAGYMLLAIGLWWQIYWEAILPGVALVGLSLALTASPLSTAIMAAAGDAQTGSASGINNMVARMSQLMAVASMGALATILYARFVRATPLPDDIAELMVNAGFGERLTGPLYQITTQQIQFEGMNHTLAVIFCVIAVSCLCGALAGFFTQDGRSASDADSVQ